MLVPGDPYGAELSGDEMPLLEKTAGRKAGRLSSSDTEHWGEKLGGNQGKMGK